jgi:hypothetical protein
LSIQIRHSHPVKKSNDEFVSEGICVTMTNLSFVNFCLMSLENRR